MTNPPTLLRVLVTRHHWQVYKTFCVQFDKAADLLAEVEGDPHLRGLSVSKRTFERWMGGEVHTLPRPDQCRVLEYLFKRPVTELLQPPVATVAAPSTALVPAISQAFKSVETSMPLSARSFDQATLHNPDHEIGDIGGQIKMAANRARRFAAMAEGSTLGAETLAQLHDDVRQLTFGYPRLPLTVLFGDLVTVQDTAFRFLEAGWQRPNQTRDLYLLASIASGMLAKASHDLGDPHAAMAQARTAFVCADKADHNELRAWVRGLQSLIAYWAGQPQDAANFAQRGNNIHSRASGTAAVWLHALEARASAALGDDEAASRAIAATEDAREQVTDNDLDSYGGILTFPRARQLYYVADTTVRMESSTATAEERALDAVAAYQQADEDWAFGDQAGSHTALALARIQTGDLDGVQEAIRPVLDLPREQRINGIVTSLRQVHGALCTTRWVTAPTARDVRDEIEEFAHFSLRALPC